MPLASIYRERTQGKLWIVALVVFLAGLLLLLYAEYLYTVHLPIFAAVIANFGGVIIASLGLGVIWELYLKRAFVEEIFDAAGISRQVHEAKLRGVTTDFNHGVDWVQIIDQAKQLDMMVYAANTWRNVHSKQLAALAARQGAKINLILPDPTIDSVIQELARRFNTPSDVITRMIEDTVTFFRELAENPSSKATIRIWHLCEAPLYTFYRLDNTYVLSMYRHNRKGNIPTLVCYKGGVIADFIDEQFQAICQKDGNLSKLIYPAREPIRPDAMQVDTMGTIEPPREP